MLGSWPQKRTSLTVLQSGLLGECVTKIGPSPEPPTTPNLQSPEQLEAQPRWEVRSGLGLMDLETKR